MINTDMKILEILLPKNLKDKDLSDKHATRIDSLQKRMNTYVDKISDPATSTKGKEFLKAKLKDDYDELKGIIKDSVNEAEGDTEGLPHLTKELLSNIVDQIGTEGANAIVKSLQWGDGAADELLKLIHSDLRNHVSLEESVKQRLDKSCWKGYRKSGTKVKGGVTVNNCVANEDTPKLPAPIKNVMYVIVDGHTGEVISKPYESRRRASARADRLDNEYGAYRYKVRMIDNNPMVTESVNKLPLTNEDFELVKQLMSHPIPAIVAPIYIQEIIDDDEFNNTLLEIGEATPGADIRPHVVEWFKRVMPDQMHRFYGGQTAEQREGNMSVIHGYDPQMYHGTDGSITGDAFGSK